MTNCTQASLHFPGCQGRWVEADFSGGEITGDSGPTTSRDAGELRFACLSLKFPSI